MRRLLATSTRFLALLVLAGPVSRLAVDQKPEDLTSLIRDSVAAWSERNHRPAGLAVGVYRQGRTILNEGFGTVRQGSGNPVTPHTVFHLASVTKPMVATAVMQLVEGGKVDIDAPISRYLPYFTMRDPRAATITVRQLLTHTSGMPDVTDYGWDRPEYDDGALERYIRGLADSTLLFAPGTRWQYSNIGFEVLADLIAKISGVPFEDYVQEHIITPLGMRHSTLLMTDVDSANLASGHVRNGGGEAVVSPVYPYNRRHAASSTLHSNMDDMLRWAAANVHHGALDGQRILAPSTLARMWTMAYDRTQEVAERARRTGNRMRYDAIGQGIGWRVFTLAGKNLINHSGGDTGFRSDVLLWPSDSSAVIVMMNDESGDVSELSRIIFSILATREVLR